jgi:hypothetical protein
MESDSALHFVPPLHGMTTTRLSNVPTPFDMKPMEPEPSSDDTNDVVSDSDGTLMSIRVPTAAIVTNGNAVVVVGNVTFTRSLEKPLITVPPSSRLDDLSKRTYT